ncbi:MAG: hypothetical protein KDB00_19420 [Planctomycetales bacterium]|nr:hypothetical protein [Planctomycetales bacterium]
MSTASLLAPSERPHVVASALDDNPFEVVAHQLRVAVYVVLRSSDGSFHRRVSRRLTDIQQDRDLAAKLIRALREKARRESWDLIVGLERIRPTNAYEAGRQAALRGAFRVLACPGSREQLDQWNAGYDSVASNQVKCV